MCSSSSSSSTASVAQQPPKQFDGLKPYRIDTTNLFTRNDTTRQYPDPLQELQIACTKRGIASENDGLRRNGAPWGFTLAELKHQHQQDQDPDKNNNKSTIVPSVRTIGFQRITKDGMDWLTKIPKSSDNNNNKNGDSASDTQQLGPVAICFSHGTYPPPVDLVSNGAPKEFLYNLMLH
jgi:hypothetical protein